MVSMHREHADAAASENGAEVIPLYRTPQTCPHVVGRTTLHCSLTPLTLTDEEREAVGFFLEKHRKIQREGENYCCLEASPHADAIQGLLGRLA
jgi:hypothetical protein